MNTLSARIADMLNVKQGSCEYQLLKYFGDYEANALITKLCAGTVIVKTYFI